MPLNGPATARVLLSENSSGRGISGLQFSPDGNYVLYFDNGDRLGIRNLYSVPFRGSPNDLVKLNRDLTNSNSVLDYAISPDSNYVVYQVGVRLGGNHELYSVPIYGSAETGVRLNKNPSVGPIERFRISPDHRRVIYTVFNEQNRAGELYSVPLTGSSIDGILLYVGQRVSNFEISLDSSRIVFLVEQNSRYQSNLFSVEAEGSINNVTRLNANRTYMPGGVGKSYYLTSDSRFVVFGSAFSDGSRSTQTALYRIPIQGPALVAQSLDIIPVANNTAFLLMPGDDRILYLLKTPAVSPIPPRSELFMVSIPTSNPAPDPTSQPSPHDRPHYIYLPLTQR